MVERGSSSSAARGFHRDAVQAAWMPQATVFLYPRGRQRVRGGRPHRRRLSVALDGAVRRSRTLEDERKSRAKNTMHRLEKKLQKIKIKERREIRNTLSEHDLRIILGE